MRGVHADIENDILIAYVAIHGPAIPDIGDGEIDPVFDGVYVKEIPTETGNETVI